MVGCDVKKMFEIISCKRAKKHLQEQNLAKYYTAKKLIIVFMGKIGRRM